MSLEQRAIGTIGGKSCTPTVTITARLDRDDKPMFDKENKPLESWFMRFTAYCETTREPKVKDDQNKLRLAREPVQFILIDTPRNRKVFFHLEQGRYVLGIGDLAVSPRVVNGVMYKNIKIHCREIVLLDSPRQHQQQRAIKDQVLAGVLTKEKGETISKDMGNFYDKRSTEGTRQVVQNKMDDTPKAKQSTDPDVPEFDNTPAE